MAMFRLKPIVVEAIQIDVDTLIDLGNDSP